MVTVRLALQLRFGVPCAVVFALLGCETKPAAPRNAALPTISLDEEQIHAHDQGPPKPTLVLLLAEFGLNSHTLRAVGSFDERPTADTLVDQLISEGWNCVNAEPSIRRSVSVKDAATAFSVASVQAECRRSKADVALVGSVVATTPGPSEIAAGMMPATAHVSLRAVDCKSDQVLTTLSKSYGDITTLDVNGHSASVKAFRLAGQGLAAVLPMMIMERWLPGDAGASER